MTRQPRNLTIGRWTLTWTPWRRSRYAVRRPTFRRGGQATPGPWWEIDMPLIGSFVLGRDRTLFGWSDPANHDHPPVIT